jgi:hypothetical protein
MDIWLQNARTIENNITVTIPAGYTVEGLQELNVNVDNESGAFISTATTEGNKLLITTKKLYKKNFDKKELWSNYVAFLEAGYKFSQQKVVLKKIESPSTQPAKSPNSQPAKNSNNPAPNKPKTKN